MTAERHTLKIDWKAFRRGFCDGFTGGPLWRAIGRVWRQEVCHRADHLLSWVYTRRIFGPRCPDYAEHCPCCNAWKIHDEVFNDR